MPSIIEALSLLTPFDVDRGKGRIGPPRDGGYVLLPGLFDGQTVLSYGVDHEYGFDRDMAARGHRVKMFDHTIDGIDDPTGDPRLCWIKEGVAGARDEARRLGTLDDHLAAHVDPAERDLILKMDVEGSEYAAFEAASTGSLLRFQQIVVEIHGLHGLGDEAFRRSFVGVLSRLNRHFTIFHVHGNNFDGSDTYTFLAGVPVCNLIEVSFVRSDLVERRPSRTLYPTHLDRPCVHPRDKRLWFFPFLPTVLDGDAFAQAEQIGDLVTESKLSAG